RLYGWRREAEGLPGDDGVRVARHLARAAGAGTIQRRRAIPVVLGQDEIPEVGRPGAPAVVHDRVRVEGRDRRPVRVLDAVAGRVSLGPDVLVPEAEHVTERVAQDAGERVRSDPAERRAVDEDVAVDAGVAGEERAGDVGRAGRRVDVEDDEVVVR